MLILKQKMKRNEAEISSVSVPNFFKRSSLGFLLFSQKNRALSEATSRTQDNGTVSKRFAGGH